LYVVLFLFFSRPRSEASPHHGRTFSTYLCPLSFCIYFFTGSSVHALMLSIQAVRCLPRLLAPGIVPCISMYCMTACNRAFPGTARGAERRNAERVERPECRMGLILTLILTLSLFGILSVRHFGPFPPLPAYSYRSALSVNGLWLLRDDNFWLLMSQPQPSLGDPSAGVQGGRAHII